MLACGARANDDDGDVARTARAEPHRRVCMCVCVCSYLHTCSRICVPEPGRAIRMSTMRETQTECVCVCEFTCVCVHLNIQPYTIFRVTAAPADDDDDAAEEHAENVR